MKELKRIRSSLLLLLAIVLFSVSVHATGFFPVFDANINLVYDDFQGSNGDPWNSALWTETPNPSFLDGDRNAEIFNDKGRVNVDGDGAAIAVYNWMTTDQNVWSFTDSDDINFSFIFEDVFKTSGTGKARILLHDTAGTGFVNDCVTGNPIICAAMNSDENGFYIDGNLITTSPTPVGGKITFRVQKVNDQNNYNIEIYLDANKEASRTITRNSLDLNFSFGCMSSGSGNDVRCDYGNLDINGIDYADGNGIIADFNSNPLNPITLDAEAGITNVQVLFDSNSTLTGILDVNYTWKVDGETTQVDTNAQFIRDFNGSDTDFNISLLVVGRESLDGNTFTSQKDQNILLRNPPQNIDITFSFNPTANSADVNFTATPAGQNAYVWGFPGDQNLTGQTVSKSFTTGDLRQVCVTITGVGDLNKTACEDFFNTHVISKVPIDISTLVTITTPWDASLNTVPGQAYNQVSVDQNFWFFYQTPDQNFFNLIVDANVNFLVTTLLVQIGGTDFNQTFQPYVVPATLGIQVILTTVDGISNEIVPAVVLVFDRTVAGAGEIETGSGITDDLGRVSLPFIPNIDHNFTLEFPAGTFLKSGIYNPQTIDATNGVKILVPSQAVSGDTNAIGIVDINYLQSQVDPNISGTVDMNQIVSSSRPIATIKIDVDHNAVNLFTDTNSSAVATGGVFSQTVNVSGLSRLLPLIITYTITFNDGNTFIQTKAITIASQGNLFDSFTNAKQELGDIGGTMILSAFVLALLLGIIHFSFPLVDNSHSFVIAALFLLFLSFVGYVDGISWVFAALAGGTAYFLRRLDK